ncbi:uncharacterized protein LOC108681966 [Hyalella azteca]|uniref:Uncharacterized protein LOC108681966 n=1 Tax=Hyalella azteca TaxID=294128 RepID=A0A8B7PKL8_HYAAZ|nr:uncharacterized protein LOC108681966 [Hyalella azteca]
MISSLDELHENWPKMLLPHVWRYSDFNPEGKKVVGYDFKYYLVFFDDGSDLRVDVNNCIDYIEEEEALPRFLKNQLRMAGLVTPGVGFPLSPPYPTVTAMRKFKMLVRNANIFIIMMATRNVNDFLEDAALHHKYAFRSRETPMSDVDKRLVMMASWNTYVIVLKFMVKTLFENCPSLPVIMLITHHPLLRTFILHLLVRHFVLAYCASSPDTDISEHFINVGELLMLDLQNIVRRELNIVKSNVMVPYLALLIIQNIITAIRFSITASFRS